MKARRRTEGKDVTPRFDVTGAKTLGLFIFQNRDSMRDTRPATLL
jgi:hypothetical protein